MKYSQEILEDILLDAKHGYSLADVAMRLNLPYDELLNDYYNPIYEVKQYYDSGRAQGNTDARKAIHGLAKNGSVAANQLYQKTMMTSELENKLKELDEL